MRHQSFDLRRVTAILLEQKNFGPNVIYYVFWESGGPSADDVDLEVDLKSTSGRPQVNLWYLPTHLTHLPQVDLKSTSGRLGSQPRRHKVSFLGYNKRDVAKCSYYQTCQNEHVQKHVVLEGFTQNGRLIIILCKKLRMLAPAKLYFRYLLNHVNFRNSKH